MRKSLLILLILFQGISVFAFQSEIVDEPTTIVFIRHAERAEDGTRNPPISEEGIKRSENLINSLNELDIKLSGVFSTAYKRTNMTATPTAEYFDLEIIEYDFSNIVGWLTDLIDDNSGSSILIVGHSNTTPMLINMVLGEELLEQLEEDEYGDLFVVRTSKYGTGELETYSF